MGKLSKDAKKRAKTQNKNKAAHKFKKVNKIKSKDGPKPTAKVEKQKPMKESVAKVEKQKPMKKSVAQVEKQKPMKKSVAKLKQTKQTKKKNHKKQKHSKKKTMKNNKHDDKNKNEPGQKPNKFNRNKNNKNEPGQKPNKFDRNKNNKNEPGQKPNKFNRNQKGEILSSKKFAGGNKFKNQDKQGYKRKNQDKQGQKRKVPVDWKEYKQDRKKQKVERKEAKPHYVTAEKVGAVFGVNFNAMKKKAKVAKVEELLNNIGLEIKHVLLRRSLARAIILLIKHGDSLQRLRMANLMQDSFVDLCKEQTGHHVVLQLLNYGDEETCNVACEKIIKAVSKLMNNRFGNMVLDRILSTPILIKWRLLILQQIYSKAFTSMPELTENGDPCKLEEIFERQPAQKVYVLENMRLFIENTITKAPSLIILQVVLYQFLCHASPSSYAKMIDEVTPKVMSLMTCKEGGLAVARAFDYTSAKQRKKMLQILKEAVLDIAMDKDTCVVLIRALDVTDDTVATKKYILNSLLKNCNDILTSKWGVLTILHILCPRSPRFFKPLLEHIPEPVVASSGAERFNCKKENTVRQKELLKIILPHVIKWTQDNAEMVLTKNEPILFSMIQKIDTTTDDAQKLLQTLAKVAIANLSSMFRHKIAHRRLRGLVELCPPVGDVLLSNLSDDHIRTVAKLRGAIVLVRCLQRSAANKEKIVNVLQPLLEELKETEGTNVKILLEEAGLV